MDPNKSLTLKDKEFQKMPMRTKEEHIRLAESYGDRYRETRNLWDIIEASRHYFEAAEYAKSADIVLDISEYLYRFGYMEKAKELNIKTIKTTRGRRRATATNNLANIYYAQGNYPEALRWYEKSIKIKEEIGDQAGLATTYNNIASIHYARGNYQEALRWYERSIKIKEEIGDQAGLATTYNNIGEIHRAQGNYQEALRWYERSIAIFKEVGSCHSVAVLLRNIGLLYRDTDKKDKAKQCLQQSYQLYLQLNLNPEADEVKQLLG